MSQGFRTFNVLFLCKQNSARSILAEAVLNRLGAGRFEAASAGFEPVPAISPYALALLHKISYNTGKLKTKALHAVLGERDPTYDFVIRLSPEQPASGHWPQFNGLPVRVDWFLPDPCEATGSSAQIAAVYAEVFNTLVKRIDALANLPTHVLDSATVGMRLDALANDAMKMAS